jgi:uncharacterized protein (UPF0333 family)
MMKKLLIAVIVVAVGGVFFYMTTASAKQECRVCVEFKGRRNCATAAGATVQQATEGAHTTACGPLVSGMNETIACGNKPPLNVQCRTR